ncbi:MAG: response regulator [Planctomycetota bacterium]
MFANRKAVLHVDDDPLITRLVAEYLHHAGFESEAVHDPLMAIAAMVRGQYRIVLLDIHMPHRSGLQLLSEITSLDAGVQVIMLTGLVNETTVIEAMRQGAEACLFKPLTDPAPLIREVEDAYEFNNRWWGALRDLTQRRRVENTYTAASPAQLIEA